MSVSVISKLEIQNGANSPIIDAEDAKGAWSTVDDVAARDLIPSTCRRLHMVVTLADTGVSYELATGLTNADWVVKSFPSTPAVSSVFGRTGAVAAANGDYTSTQVSNSSGVTGSTVTAALNALASLISALVTGVSSAFGRTGAVTAQSGDYTSTQVSNSSGVAGSTVTAALNALASLISALVTGVSSAFGRTGAVVAANGDYNSTQVTNSSGVTGSTVTAALNALAAHKFVCLNWGAAAAPGTTAVRYFTRGGGTLIVTLAISEWECIIAGTVTVTMSWSVSTALATDSIALMFMLNGNTTALSTTMNAGVANGQTSQSITLAVGDRLTVRLTQSGTEAQASWNGTVNIFARG